MYKILLISAVLTIAAACSSSKKVVPSQPDIVKVNAVYPDLTLADFNQGKILYGEKCIACHALKNPTSLTPERWPSMVADMTNKANKNAMRIDPTQEALIIKYLVTVSTPAK
ncbi:MAG: hypothetical protein KA797_06995 [Chitinophagales bacterium]|nr:hypothetical protein [Chitinophagales bacterium]